MLQICSFIVSSCHAAASNIFSINIPYPVVGSFTSTWVTAPTSFPSCIIGEPDTSVSSREQKTFVFFFDFYSFLQVKGRFLHTPTAVLNLTQVTCRKRRLFIFLSVSTNFDFERCASTLLCNNKSRRFPNSLRRQIATPG